jgi:hypothetical protein
MFDFGRDGTIKTQMYEKKNKKLDQRRLRKIGSESHAKKAGRQTKERDGVERLVGGKYDGVNGEG